MWRYILQRTRFCLAGLRHRAAIPLGCSELTVSCGPGAPTPSKLLVVAHPDDECLFAGEALTSSAGWRVVCVTGASNPVRRREFVEAMESIGASYIMLDHADDLMSGNFHPRLQQQLTALLHELPYELVVTHNARGEYGHPQHRAIHRIVRRLATHVPLYVFGHSWVLRPRMSAAKRALFDHYPSERKSIEHKSFLTGREQLRRIH